MSALLYNILPYHGKIRGYLLELCLDVCNQKASKINISTHLIEILATGFMMYTYLFKIWQNVNKGKGLTQKILATVSLI